jgi:hypothetical protein
MGVPAWRATCELRLNMVAIFDKTMLLWDFFRNFAPYYFIKWDIAPPA